MSKEDWEDLLYDLLASEEENKMDQRYRLASHMAKMDEELESLKLRVNSLEARANGGES